MEGLVNYKQFQGRESKKICQLFLQLKKYKIFSTEIVVW